MDARGDDKIKDKETGPSISFSLQNDFQLEQWFAFAVFVGPITTTREIVLSDELSVLGVRKKQIGPSCPRGENILECCS